MKRNTKKILPRRDSNSDSRDRRQHSLPLSHRVILFIHWFSIDKGQHFILVCLFELMLNAPFNSYVQTETLPPIHEAFIQN